MISAGVISWHGMQPAAAIIADGVVGRVTDLVVIYSNREGLVETGAGRWIGVPDADFFGRKFRRLLDEVPLGHALLLIQADASCSNWGALVERFASLLRTRDDVGLWSPEIDNTAFPTDLVAVGPDRHGLREVVQTDGIVLGIAPRVVDRLRQLDYQANNLGWGIDWAAIAHCRGSRLKAVRDLTQRVSHPVLRRYDGARAEAQMQDFLGQLTREERDFVADALDFLKARKNRKDGRASEEAQDVGINFIMNTMDHGFDDALLAHVTALAVHGGEILISPRDPAVKLALDQGDGRPQTLDASLQGVWPRVLAFVQSPDSSTKTELVTGFTWSYPRKSTLQTVFARGLGPRRVPMTEPLDLPAGCGDVHLRFGVVAHRANIEVIVEVADVEDGRAIEEFVFPVDPKYTGLLQKGDYQKIDVRISGADPARRVRVLLNYLDGEEERHEPPLALASRPYLVGAAAAGITDSPIVYIADDHPPGQAPEFALQVAPTGREVSILVGEQSHTLIPARQDGVTLRFDGTNVLATADLPVTATLFINGRARRTVWVGPEPLVLEVEASVIEHGDATFELRDATGSLVKARCEVARDSVIRRVDQRHPDAWAIDDLFDAAFYLSGFPEGSRPHDPASHYLTEGWRKGHDPAPWFSTWHYLAMHPDVAAAGMNPFLHYCIQGKIEGRALPQLGRSIAGEVYAAHALAVAPGPEFEEFDPTIAIGRRPRAKVLAYYLPQFHPIDVNDKQWGKGFTEWRQLPRGMPRFMGHIQPRIPRDLGCYSLAEGDAMRRQIAMAKAAGLFGFCFYHYWFDGRRVLEAPMERFLADPTLDFPFCLMWANENWTRTWDGSEKEVILGQHYRDEDDIPFIDDLARHMEDPRYIRIGDRPLFFIYRPEQIPQARETIERWRSLFATRHGLAPLIMMAQGFNDIDPRGYGLDGAIEFPPHKLCQGLPPINASVRLLDPDYKGHILSYDAMIERATSETSTEFPLIRTVTPTWDNEARRPGRGMILEGSTPKKFGAWMKRSLDFARANPVHGEHFVCVNAWNEWAEGAVLEPDVHYGGAYLNALSRAVHGVAQANAGVLTKVVIVSHDAHINGAQMLALNIGQTLVSRYGVEVHYVLGDEGPLLERYRAIGKIKVLRPGVDDGRLAFAELALEGHTIAITNTTPAGRLVPALKDAGFRIVSLIHELPSLLKSYRLATEARNIARHSDRVLFPAQVVRDGFEAFAGPIAHDAEVFPQGLYNTAALKQPPGDHGLRAELGLDPDTRIVLGVGYADLRKGIDRFISAGLSLAAAHADIAFLWVGAPAGEATNWFLPEIEASGLGDRVRILGHREDVARFYAAADAFYLSSREDPFPSVVLEALASGLPVVGHRGCGGCDDLTARHGTLVAQNDPLAAAGALLQALQLPDREAALARRAEIVEHYDFDAYVFGLLQRLDPDLVPVSAVIPNYNYESYIGERLRSVFDQTYPLREVIVLDDASPDDSVAEIERTAQAAGRTIALHVNAKNSGSPFPQWRKGVELARGDYVWIAEADDLADPAFVARLVERMQRAGSVLGFTDSRQIDEHGAPLGDSYRPYINQIEPGAFDAPFDMDGPEFLARFLAVKNVILNVSGVVLHRQTLLDAFDAVGDDLYRYSVAGDWRLYAEICARPGSRVTWLPEPLNTHRRHRVSVTHALKAEKHLAEIAEMHKMVGEKVALDAETFDRQVEHLRACEQHLREP